MRRGEKRSPGGFETGAPCFSGEARVRSRESERTTTTTRRRRGERRMNRETKKRFPNKNLAQICLPHPKSLTVRNPPRRPKRLWHSGTVPKKKKCKPEIRLNRESPLCAWRAFGPFATAPSGILERLETWNVVSKSREVIGNHENVRAIPK